MRYRAVLLLAALSGCGGHPGKAECEQVADKMIDIFTAPRLGEGEKVPAELNQSVNEWRKILKEKEKDPTRATLVDVCTKQMSNDAAACVRAAGDERSLAKCFGG